MAAVINATPGSPTANSFTTIAFADAWNDAQLYSDDWASANEETKTKALITATRLIRDSVPFDGWQGFAVSSTQALPLPRSGMLSRTGYALPNTLIPVDLESATSELARQLVTAGALPSVPGDTAGLKRIKAGSVELEFDSTQGSFGTTELPDDIFNMISYLLVYGARGGINVPLVRA